MCLSSSEGTIDISLYFKIDPMSETIPTKGDTHEISTFIYKELTELRNYRDMLNNLKSEEHVHFVMNVGLNKRLMNITIFESLIIIVSFLIEYVALSTYLRNKQLI